MTPVDKLKITVGAFFGTMIGALLSVGIDAFSFQAAWLGGLFCFAGYQVGAWWAGQQT